MSKVQYVTIQIKPPSGSYPGRTCEGCYIDAGDAVALVDREGKPVRDHEGKEYSQMLKPGENPKVIAGRLTRQLRTALLGGKDAPGNNFDGPINYPSLRNA